MDQSMTPAEHGAINLATALKETHVCNRHCSYQHVFANVFSCQTSGQVHVCDQTCTQRMWYDPYNSICRLSKRFFPHAPEVLREDTNVERKRRAGDDGTGAASKRLRDSFPSPMQAF